MYLLILVSFLHLATVKPEPVGLFKSLDDCLIAARQLNKEHVNTPTPPEGMVHVCFEMVHAT